MHGDVFVARRQHLADRRDQPRPGHGQRRPRASPARCRSGTASGRPADPARPGARRVRPRGRGRPRPRRRRAGRGAASGSRATRPRRARRRQPRSLPRGRARGRRRPATDRRIVVERFRDELGDWRVVHPDAVRRPGPRAVGAGHRGAARASASGSRSRRSGRTTASRSACPRATPSLDGVEPAVPGSRTRSRTWSSSWSGVGALRRAGSARTPAGPCSCRGAGPARARRCGSSASGPPTCSPSRSRYGSFPILVETYRECLSDVFDLPALREVLAGRRSGARSRSTHVETARASPFASSLLFDYVAAYMYEGDAPLAERRAQALTLDRDLLRELLGQEELRDLLDPDALAELELSLQALAEDRRRATADQVHDLLRRLGDLTARRGGGADRRRAGHGEPGSRSWRRRGGPSGSGSPARSAGSRSRTSPATATRSASSRPPGVPRPSSARRRMRSTACWHGGPGPTARSWPRSRRALGPAGGRRRGRAAPGSSARARSCAASSGRAARSASGATRRSCAGCAAGRSPGSRREVEPVDRPPLGRFLPAWHGVPRRRPPRSAAPRCAARRARTARRGRRPARRPADPGLRPGARRPAGPRPRLPAAPARRAGRARRGRLGRAGEPRPRRRPGRPASGPAARRCGRAGRPTGSSDPAGDPPRRASAITSAGAARGSTASSRRPAARSDREVLDALWDLVWAGEVTNDTFAPLRALRWKRPARITAAAGR